MSTPTSRARRTHRAGAWLLLLLPVGGCAEGHRDAGGRYTASHRALPQVLSLGNLRAGHMPTRPQITLAKFLFGAEPDAPPALFKPAALLEVADALLIADPAAQCVVRWDARTRAYDALRWDAVTTPVALAATDTGELLLVDSAAAAVVRARGDGQAVARYTLAADFRPAAALPVGAELWVSNVALHRIEVFDLETGEPQRSIGARGVGPGEFGIPLGLARSPAGNVLVVDMLNARVQEFDSTGAWRRDIGGPGDRVGRFGRPKDVAVGPDGTIFVTDAASQRVHVFDAGGEALLAFGEPEEGGAGLALPAGIAVVRNLPMVDRPSLGDFPLAYYVVVAEQVREPGARVFAWSGATIANVPAIERPRVNAAGTRNPHWSADDCGACHPQGGGPPQAILAAEVDRGCLNCHDGRKAVADAHPTGRLATAQGISVPADWPLADSRVGCLTCHDIRGHCDRAAQRPARNPGLIRDYDPDRPLEFCGNCHVDQSARRTNPHVAAGGPANQETCRLCHTQRMEIPADGRRTGQAYLRAQSAALCLACHARHWDFSPTGHVERALPAAMTAVLLEREARLRGGPAGSAPRVLPLADERVTCYTCHNPHDPAIFPAGSDLAASAQAPADVALRLRADRQQMCLLCHVP